MKYALRKQRELCFDAWAANKSKKFPKHLWNHYHDMILNASEPEYKEPLPIALVISASVGVGAVIGFVVSLIVL